MSKHKIKLKSNFHGHTPYSNAPMKPTMMSISYTSQPSHLNYTILNIFKQEKTIYRIKQVIKCLIINKMLICYMFK